MRVKAKNVFPLFWSWGFFSVGIHNEFNETSRWNLFVNSLKGVDAWEV